MRIVTRVESERQQCSCIPINNTIQALRICLILFSYTDAHSRSTLVDIDGNDFSGSGPVDTSSPASATEIKI